MHTFKKMATRQEDFLTGADFDAIIDVIDSGFFDEDEEFLAEINAIEAEVSIFC
jgi:hypothetical protein